MRVPSVDSQISKFKIRKTKNIVRTELKGDLLSLSLSIFLSLSLASSNGCWRNGGHDHKTKTGFVCRVGHIHGDNNTNVCFIVSQPSLGSMYVDRYTQCRQRSSATATLINKRRTVSVQTGDVTGDEKVILQ